ncbi:hypothetical protein Celaphus_00016530 [Cervus elaphus hippelaphus]|uniref:Uncharacterized protein n=1 Tax=Cervus elaphus hippelaphus TaxID=46360 RepID=A0A212C438_CEREH|nr:hypothetical protein Celaphus_00016530 [Cervus elaphus hippelaphus]
MQRVTDEPRVSPGRTLRTRDHIFLPDSSRLSNLSLKSPCCFFDLALERKKEKKLDRGLY